MSVIGSLLLLVQVLVAYIFKSANADLRKNIDELRQRLEKDPSAVLAERMETVNRGLVRVESRFDQYTKDKEKFDYDFRHGEYNIAITSINTQLWPLGERYGALEKRLDSLHHWKHEVGEAYLPRAVDEHERRLNRLEARVFNGSLKATS